MLAAIDSFWIFIAFVAVSVISNWIKKKAENQQTGDWPEELEPPAVPPPVRRSPPPATAAAPAPGKQLSWEEELRRVLEGSAPTTSAPPPLPPPIVVVERKPVPLPPRPAPVVMKNAPILSKVIVEDTSKGDEAGEALASLSESAASHARVSHFQAQMAQRFQRIDEQTSHATPAVPIAHRTSSTPESLAMRSLLRNPASLRQAVVASLILGPPKALEN